MTNQTDALPVVAWAFDRTAMNWTTDPVRDNLNPDKLHGLVWRDAAEAELSELREYKTWYDEAISASNEHGYACMSAADVINAQAEELTALRARLAQLEQQKPVAVLYPDDTTLTRKQCQSDEVFDICCKAQKPLYAALAEPASCEVVLLSDCVEGSHPEYGRGYFFTADAIQDVAAW